MEGQCLTASERLNTQGKYNSRQHITVVLMHVNINHMVLLLLGQTYFYNMTELYHKEYRISTCES